MESKGLKWSQIITHGYRQRPRSSSLVPRALASAMADRVRARGRLGQDPARHVGERQRAWIWIGSTLLLNGSRIKHLHPFAFSTP